MWGGSAFRSPPLIDACHTIEGFRSQHAAHAVLSDRWAARARGGGRIYSQHVGLTTFTNFVYDRIALLKSGYPSVFDAELGYIPMPGYRGTANVWGTSVTIGEHGVRSNGTKPSPAFDRPLLLAVGDSFVFGDQVSDEETWPALLERALHHRVINGGVFGYGIDQVVIRAEQLMDVYDVEYYNHEFYRRRYPTGTVILSPGSCKAVLHDT